jgi:hypothetical protein
MADCQAAGRRVSVMQVRCPQLGAAPFRRQVFPRESNVSQQVIAERIQLLPPLPANELGLYAASPR